MNAYLGTYLHKGGPRPAMISRRHGSIAALGSERRSWRVVCCESRRRLTNGEACSANGDPRGSLVRDFAKYWSGDGGKLAPPKHQLETKLERRHFPRLWRLDRVTPSATLMSNGRRLPCCADVN